MVPDKHRGTGLKVFLAGEDLEADADEEGHGVFEGAGGGPLGGVVGAHETEGEGGQDTVEGAEGEGEVGD